MSYDPVKYQWSQVRGCGEHNLDSRDSREYKLKQVRDELIFKRQSSSIIDSARPTYLETLCVLSDVSQIWVVCLRIPYCFLLLGGIVTGLCLLGLCLVSVCEKAALEAKQELPSLDMKEVIRTRVFYQVNIIVDRNKKLWLNTTSFQIWWGFFTVSVTHVSCKLNKHFPKAQVTKKRLKTAISIPS